MKDIAVHLKSTVRSASEKFSNMTAQDWELRKAPGKWSKKEIIGHLIDSAANNHQRFVRAQYGDKTPISYDGDIWVKVQDYKDAPSSVLIELWTSYNLHLAHVISKIPDDKYNTLFHADGKEAETLEWLVKDYVKHLEHHIGQILP